MRLHPDNVEALARRVAELLGGTPAPRPVARLVDAQTLADLLSVSRATVYGHAVELGGRQLGSGGRSRWRFDAQIALAAWSARGASERSPAELRALAGYKALGPSIEKAARLSRMPQAEACTGLAVPDERPDRA